VNIVERMKAHPLYTLGVLVVTLFLAGFWTHEYINAESRNTEVDMRVRAELDQWNFTADLYKGLPNDVDFIVRTLSVSMTESSAITLVGPSEYDNLTLTLSRIRETGVQEFHALIRVDGRVGKGMAFSNVTWPVTIKRGVLSGPFPVGNFEFYVYVSEIDPDGTTYVTLARRVAADAPVAKGMLFQNNVGSILLGVARPRPDPIIAER